MSTHKRIDAICIVVIMCGLILTVLFMNGEALGIRKIVDEDSPYYQNKGYFTSNDRNGNFDEDQADTVITMNGETVSVRGNGAYVLNGDIYITGAGKYILTGNLTDGRIIVDAYNSSKVWLLLKDVDISCLDDAAIIVEQAEKVFLTLAEGTDNIITGADTYNEQAVEEEHNGAIFSRDDLTINGAGSLTVNAGYMHGIVSKDDLVITGGNITVNAEKDAVKANKNICIADAQITLTSGDDALMVNQEGGVLYIESGTIEMISEGDAVNSLGDVIIAGGNITMDAKDDGIHSDTHIQISAGSILIQKCYEGLEAPTIEIIDGDITIYSTDDGINANGNNGDSFGMGGGPSMGGRQESAEEAPDGEEETGESTGAASPGESSGEGRPEDSQGAQTPGESPGGERSEDSQGAQTPGESPGEERPEDSQGTQTPDESSEEETRKESEESWIRISGGNLTIINENGNDADGLDSNGDIYITGGSVKISLTGRGANCAIDYGSESGGVCEISGGTIVAAGGSSMAEPFSDSSQQCSLLYTCSELTDPGTKVSVMDPQGTEILSWEVPCSFSSVYLSCPDMTEGETYTVITGDEETSVTLESASGTYGTSSGGSFPGPSGFPGR